MTITWTITGAPDAGEVEAIATLLGGGGVALLPTDTIYGLHALATDDAAIARIVALKGRDGDKPLVVLGASIAQLEQLGAQLPAASRGLLEELWPGPLTAVVPLTRPVAASRGATTLAVRVPDVQWFRDLLQRVGPLASTSANRSGEAPIGDPRQLSPDLLAGLDGVVDSGSLPGEPSTIVDFTGAEPRLIRPGETFFTQKVWKTLRKSL